MQYHDIVNRLIQIDQAAETLFPGKSFDCVIVGGAALLLRKAIQRGTLDGDVLDSAPALNAILEAYDFNTAVQTYSCCFAYDYVNRLIPIDVPTKCIRFFTPSIEDLIVSKLYAFRKKDREDLDSIKSSGEYDSKRLAMIVNEADCPL